MKKHFGIIGGGLIGLAVAYKLSLKYDEVKITLLEKENEVGKHQSSNNSGVLHCGLAYQPGSLKADLARNGIQQMIEFCRKHEVAHEICGKLVVCNSPNKEKTLHEIARRGELNGLKGLKILSAKQARLIEPHIGGTSALLVPEEGIVDFRGVMQELKNQIQENGSDIKSDVEVIGINDLIEGKVLVETTENEYQFDNIIVCAGLQSDKLYKLATGKEPKLKIIPFRGDYYNLKKEYSETFNNLVYPLPDIKFPFLGVHFTRMIGGQKEIGPNAVLAFKREGYKLTDFSLKEFSETLTYIGLQKFLIKNFKFSYDEFKSSLRRKDFVKKGQELIPDLKSHMIVKGSSGVRAQAISNKGELVMDFVIEKYNNQIHVLNAPSPGATASLAIADYIISKTF